MRELKFKAIVKYTFGRGVFYMKKIICLLNLHGSGSIDKMSLEDWEKLEPNFKCKYCGKDVYCTREFY